MGSRAHGLALARPLAVDGVHLAAGRREQARPRAGRRLRARRGSGRGRRARRHSRPDAPDRAAATSSTSMARGASCTTRRERAEPAAGLRARAALRSRGAVRPVEPDRGHSRDARAAFRRTARTAMSCRSSIRRRRPSPIPAASSSSSPKARGAITAGRAETWRADYEARLARHRAAIRAETDRLGWSFTIHRTDRAGDRTAARAARPHRRKAQRRRHATAGRTARRSGGRA